MPAARTRPSQQGAPRRAFLQRIAVVVLHPLASVTVNVCVPVVQGNVPVPVYGGVPPVAVIVTVAVSVFPSACLSS